MIERECCFRPPTDCPRSDGAFCADSLRRLVQLVVPALAGQREVTLWDMAALHIIARSVSEEKILTFCKFARTNAPLLPRSVVCVPVEELQSCEVGVNGRNGQDRSLQEVEG